MTDRRDTTKSDIVTGSGVARIVPEPGSGLLISLGVLVAVRSQSLRLHLVPGDGLFRRLQRRVYRVVAHYQKKGTAFGVVVDVEARRITLSFPAVGEERTYSIDNAPLTRLRFKVGDHISTVEGVELIDLEKASALETKIAILYKKAELHKKHIPQDVAIFIASNIKSNIRELEGFLLRIIAYSSFTHRELDLELTKEVLKDFTFDKTRNFTIQNILKTVADFYGVKVSDIKSKRRTREISNTRQTTIGSQTPCVA